MESKDIVTIFEIARVNGGEYRGEHLPSNQWKFPKGTWLQRRLEELRDKSDESKRHIL